MKAKIVLLADTWKEIKNFLFPSKSIEEERVGFAICGIGKSNDQISHLVREFVPLEKSDLFYTYYAGIKVKPQKIIELINRSYPKGLSLIEIHSHPWKGKASFSSLDIKGVKEMVNYLFPQFPGIPYAAMVLTFNSFAAQVWFKKNKVETELKIIGGSYITPSASLNNTRGGRFDRQERFFGDKVQDKIEQFRMGIVGVGGTGSHVAQQLAYLGVRDFVLVDPDEVELSNLNRLIGASKRDLGIKKVEVIKRYIKFIRPEARVLQLSRAVYQTESVSALKKADFIFGCVDNDAARLVINNTSVAYLIPYIDLGTDINLLPNGSIESVGGRVFCVFPGGPCLLCSDGEIDQEEVRNDLSSREILGENIARGYAQNRISRPAIISVNGIVSSQAITEFIFFVMGITRPVRFWYDIYGQLMHFSDVKKKDGCIHCIGNFGLGDMARIEDYGRNKLD